MKLSPGAELAWRLAAEEAHALLQTRIDREHLALGLLGLERAVLLQGDREGLRPAVRRAVLAEHDAVKAALEACGLKVQGFADALRAALPRGARAGTAKVISRTPEAKAAFARAGALAAAPDAAALLAALLQDPGEPLAGALACAGTDAGTLARSLERGRPGEAPPRRARPPEPAARGSALERYGRDLTRLAREGKLGPVLGRRPVLLQVLQTLSRATKNNVVLVGEAGVGKTAVVEALALRAAEGKDPKVLGGKRIVELQLGALLAGTKMRGEFEERLQRVLTEAREDPDLIVFIDELHTVIGAGHAEGGADAANLLKPALARGEFRCIGATTLDEFRKRVEGDPALERRFEKVLVPEATREETLEILRGLRPRWEAHHHVVLPDAALEAAVDLAVRFDRDHRLPDKALDLVDRAAARTSVPSLSMRADGGALAAGPGGPVEPEAVAAVVSEKTGVPLALARAALAGAAGAAARLKGLEPRLRERLVGQDAAVARVCRRLAAAHAGLEDRRGPLAVLLFLGPSGVGKTELARRLAEELGAGLIRLDMSEFMEEHSVAKLTGSPPGYVGYEDEGQLTGPLRSQPSALVLLDEVEKAHPRVLDLFLQLFDEGRVTDAKGRTADARHAVFVMTSNLGTAEAGKRPIGFGEREGEVPPAVDEAVRGHFRRELLNRIDERVVFRSLEPADAREILERLLSRLLQELRARAGAELEVPAEVRDALLTEGFSREAGARAVDRAVGRLLRDPLGQLAVDGRLERGARYRAALRDGRVVVEPDGRSRDAGA